MIHFAFHLVITESKLLSIVFSFKSYFIYFIDWLTYFYSCLTQQNWCFCFSTIYFWNVILLYASNHNKKEANIICKLRSIISIMMQTKIVVVQYLLCELVVSNQLLCSDSLLTPWLLNILQFCYTEIYIDNHIPMLIPFWSSGNFFFLCLIFIQ